jgi:hypothetical protein
MPRRFFFGPLTAEFAGSRVEDLRRADGSLTFGPGGDLSIGPGEKWSDVVAQFPPLAGSPSYSHFG